MNLNTIINIMIYFYMNKMIMNTYKIFLNVTKIKELKCLINTKMTYWIYNFNYFNKLLKCDF